MKFYLSIFFTLNCFSSFSQKDVRKISVADLPKNLQDFSNVSSVIRWTDSLGDNIMIVTKKVIENVEPSKPEYEKPFFSRKLPHYYKQNNPGASSTRLVEKEPPRAFHYLVLDDSAILTWQAIGIPRLCKEDISFSKSWFTVTDLDNNSIAEVWLIYKTNCPDSSGLMKIVMYEADKKYSAIGRFADQSFQENFFDANFRQSPILFQKYAIRLWDQYSKDQ